MAIIKIQNAEELKTAKKAIGVGLNLCTTKGTIEDLFNNLTTEDSDNISKKVFGTPHTSIFEYPDLIIAADDVSMLFELELIQYRLASYTIKSRRYVNFTGKGVVDSMRPHKYDGYDAYIDSHINFLFEAYNILVEQGHPKEECRFILPLGLKSNILFKMNLIELLNMMCSLSEYNHYEFNLIIEVIFHQLKNIFPELFIKIPNVVSLREMIKPKTTLRELSQLAVIHMNAENPLYEEVEIENGIPEELRTMRKIYGTKEDNIPVVNPVNNAGIVTGVKRVLGNLLGMNPDKTDTFEVIRDNTVKRVLSTNNKILELITTTCTMNFQEVKISYASLTHLLRHRMQTVLCRPINISGGIDIGHISDNTEHLAYLKPVVEKHREYMRVYETLGMDEMELAYFRLGGDYTLVMQNANWRELMHMSHLRKCNRAQFEINDIVTKIVDTLGVEQFIPFDPVLKELGELSIDDTITKYFNAPCAYGTCKEGRFSCGKPVNVVYGKNMQDPLKPKE